MCLLCRSLAAEKDMMELKVQQEDSKNKRLSQYNEELMWKLKHSSEVVSALAALSQETPSQYTYSATLTETETWSICRILDEKESNKAQYNNTVYCSFNNNF